MGVAARQQLNTNIKNTIINFKHLLGRKFSDEITQKYRKFIPCDMVQLPNDDIGLKVYLVANPFCAFHSKSLLARIFALPRNFIIYFIYS